MKRFLGWGSLVLVLSSVLFATPAVAGELPVDADIESLKLQIKHLEFFKELLSTRQCSVSHSKTMVGLGAGALRGQGLRIAIGDSFPGNYTGYGNDLKPSDLQVHLLMAFGDPKYLVGAAFVRGSVIQKDEESAPSAIRFDLQVPTLITEPKDEDLSQGTETSLEYRGASVFLPMPLPGEGASVSYKLPTGKTFTVQCK